MSLLHFPMQKKVEGKKAGERVNQRRVEGQTDGAKGALVLLFTMSTPLVFKVGGRVPLGGVHSMKSCFTAARTMVSMVKGSSSRDNEYVQVVSCECVDSSLLFIQKVFQLDDGTR